MCIRDRYSRVTSWNYEMVGDTSSSTYSVVFYVVTKVSRSKTTYLRATVFQLMKWVSRVGIFHRICIRILLVFYSSAHRVFTITPENIRKLSLIFLKSLGNTIKSPLNVQQ